MKRHKLFFVILIGILFMLMASGCSSDQLIYQVSGAAGQAEVAYTDSDGSLQTEVVTLPWETSFKVGSSAEFSLSASADQDGVSCAVLLNDKELGSVEALRYAGCSGSFKSSGGSLSTNFSSLKDVLPDGSPAIAVEPVAESAPEVEEPAVQESASEEPTVERDLTADFVAFTSEDGAVSLSHPPDWSPADLGSGVIVVINDGVLLGPVLNEGDYSQPAAFIIGNAEPASNYGGDSAAAVLAEWEQQAGNDLLLDPLSPAATDGNQAMREYKAENEGHALNLIAVAIHMGDTVAIFMSASTDTASEQDAALAKAILDTVAIHKASGSGLAQPTTAAPVDAGAEMAAGRIIFASDRGGNFDIYTMNIDGSDLVQLTDDAAFDGQPSYSPDGKSILFISDRSGNTDIYRMKADGSGVTQLTDDPGSDLFPTWVPTTSFITFASDRDGNYDIYVMNDDGSDQIAMYRGDSNATFSTWSATAPLMAAIVSDHEGQTDLYSGDSSGNLSRLTEIGGVFSPDWSSNGRFILFAVDDGKGGSDIYIIRPDGSGLQAVTTDKARDYQPKWSPDSNYIMFVSERDGNPEIYILDQDGNEQRITNNTAIDNAPAWYPLP